MLCAGRIAGCESLANGLGLCGCVGWGIGAGDKIGAMDNLKANWMAAIVGL
jgi:hypothetical protein